MTEAVLGTRPIGHIDEEEKSKWEKLLLFLIFLLFLFSVYKVFFETQTEYGGGKIVADAHDPKGDVKRRASDRFVWNDVKNSLFLKDSVRTTDKSGLTLQFPDGGSLELGENSLVTLDIINGKLAVNVAGGKMNFKAGSGGLILQTGGKTIEAKDGAGSLSAGAGGSSIALTTGTATMTGKDGKTEALAKDNQVQIAADGQTKVSKVPAYLTAPQPSEAFASAAKGAEIAFSWKPVEGVSNLTIQVSEFPDFSQLAKSVALRPAQVNVNLTLSRGNYYWRIVSGDLISEVRSFEVTANSKVMPIDPPDRAKFILNQGKTEVVFEWQGSPFYDHYEVRFATDPDFQNVVKTIPTDRTKAQIPFEKADRYYWRIEATSTAHKVTTTSPSRMVQIEQLDHPELPELLAPARNSVLNYKDSESLFSRNKAHIGFRWQRVPGVQTYTLEVSKTSDFKRTVLRKEIEGNTYDWETRETGVLHWRIAVAPNAKTESWKFRTLSDLHLDLKAPEDHKSFIYPRAKPAVSFQWTGSAKSTYLIEFAEDASFAKPLFKQKVTGTRWSSAKIEDGKYLWRVSQLDESGAVAQVSSARSFELAAANLLAAPVMRMPFKDAKFGLSTVEFVFNWDVVPGAAKYELVIEGLPDGKRIVKTATAGVAKVRELTPGMYKWKVSAIDEYGRNGKMPQPWHFSIIHKTGPNAPRFLGLEIRDLFGGGKK